MKDIFDGIPSEGDSLDEMDKEDIFGSQPSSGENKEDEDEKEPPSHQGDEGESEDKDDSEEKPDESEDDKSDEEEGDDDEEDKNDDEPDNTDDEDNIPFHKHPRWKAINDKNKQLEADIESLKEASHKGAEPQDKGVNMPDWFKGTFGDDPDAWSKYQNYEGNMREQIKNEILQDHQNQVQAQNDATQRWNDWVETSVQDLKDQGKKFDKNKLLKIAHDYLPTDAQGNIDFNKAYDIYEMQEGNKGEDKVIKKKKEVADKSMSSGGSNAPSEKKLMTTADLRGRSWDDIL